MSRGWFEDQVAVVTGAGSGIGAATARRLAAEGCSVVIGIDINEAGMERLAAEVAVFQPETADVSNAQAVSILFERLAEQHGRVDLVVHAAGVDDPTSKEKLLSAQAQDQSVLVLDSLADEAWRRVMSINLDGTFHVLRSAARVMVRQRSGSIVTVGSSSAFDTFAGYGAYAASKAGVQALSQSAAKELAYFGIRVNTVAPGPVDTGMAARTPKEVRDQLESSGPRGYATPDEMADTICYLASPGAANLIGTVVLSNGGRFTV
jgi:3-oxoacyl-[acyl-carrier protein] reductase